MTPLPAPPRLAWALPLALGAGLLLGAAGDALGPGHRLNLLDPPLIGLLLWNLLVYAVLLARPTGPNRWAVVLHAGAGALALGALASMYLRGLAFEYRAGWESTFLDAADVHRIVTLLFTPAAWLTGLPLPGVGEIEALRVDRGPGENAGRWIHLYAVTVLAVVVLPRALLAAWAARRRPARAAATSEAHVVPYSYRVPGAFMPALRAAVERSFGAPVALRLAEPVPLGGEEALDAVLAGPAPTARVALFPLTATPEAESHGAFLAALRARSPRLLVLVDESGFAQRFDSLRRAQRREAWRRALQAQDLEPVFVDLGTPPP